MSACVLHAEQAQQLDRENAGEIEAKTQAKTQVRTSSEKHRQKGRRQTQARSTAKTQGRILAVWILAAKLPNSDLNFAVDFWVDFFLLFVLQRKRPPKIHQKIPRKIHPGLCSEKFPSDFCRSLFLTKTCSENFKCVFPQKGSGLKFSSQAGFLLRQARRSCSSA